MLGPFDILRGNELDLQLVSQSSTGNMWQGYQKSYISVSDSIPNIYPINTISLFKQYKYRIHEY
jgi:hypothetical protein